MGVCPPSKPGRTLLRACWPLCPRQLVLPGRSRCRVRRVSRIYETPRGGIIALVASLVLSTFARCFAVRFGHLPGVFASDLLFMHPINFDRGFTHFHRRCRYFCRCPGVLTGAFLTFAANRDSSAEPSSTAETSIKCRILKAAPRVDGLSGWITVCRIFAIPDCEQWLSHPRCCRSCFVSG